MNNNHVEPLFATMLNSVATPAYRPGNSTQQAAAESIAPKASSMRLQVLNYIKAQGNAGATNEEIGTALNMKLQTVCARVNELQKSRDIGWLGQQRHTDSGRDAKVWRVIPV
jgi:hypothetical protein